MIKKQQSVEALDRELAMKSKYLDDLQAIQQQYILNAQLAAQNPLQNPLAGTSAFNVNRRQSICLT